jgi:hypothetical protein
MGAAAALVGARWIEFEVPIAHSGELHASDPILLGPLLLVVLVGVVLMLRGARSGRQDSNEKGDR